MGQPDSALCGSVCGGGVREKTMLLRLAQHLPVSGHFTPFSCVTGAALAAAPVVVPRVGIFKTSVLKSASSRVLVSILLSSFSGVLFCSFIWDVFVASSFWQLPCVCFYKLGRAAMTPSLGRVALCSRCSMGSNGKTS